MTELLEKRWRQEDCEFEASLSYIQDPILEENRGVPSVDPNQLDKRGKAFTGPGRDDPEVAGSK